MKAIIPAIGLALASTAALAGDEPAQFDITPDDAPIHSPPAEDRASGEVIDPDNRERCRDRIVETYGEEADMQLRRDPALPPDTTHAESPMMVYAVDHRLDGCGVLVLTDGSKRLPPDLPDDPALIPAQ